MQAPGVPALAGTLKLAVTDGNCTPAAVTTTAGRNAIMVKLSSAKAQKIALITTASPIRHLFEHDQAGTSENWMSSVMLPAGTYELVSSLSGSKCSVTVN
jgi:hypothetical protein